MAPKSTVVSRSKQPTKPSKEKEVVKELSPEQEISEEEEEFSENENAKTTEPKSNSVPLNGFVSDSGSDYDSDDSNSGYKVQPITKPVIVSLAKRPISGSSNGGNPAKKPKTTTPGSKKSSNSGNNNSNNNVSRIWHREDEIVMLKEMYEFKKSKGGVDMNLDISAFYESVKWKLDGEYSKDQLKSKIRHMRSKYLGIVKKGGDPGFANSHEALLFDLSKKAWGDGVKGKKNVDNVEKNVDNVVNEMVVAKENGVGEKVVVAEVEEKGEKEKEGVEERLVCVESYKFLKESVDVSLNYKQSLRLSDAVIRLMTENLGLIGEKNASQLDDEWKELFMEEVELNNKRACLVKKQVELVFNRIKKP